MTARLVLGHGASGTAASMAPWVDGLRALGIEADAVDLPRGRVAAAAAVFEALARDPVGLHPPVLGGHSYGGRAASLAASHLLIAGVTVPGLVLLSYPLHRPGAPESWSERTAHWPILRCPVLLLSGESDPFARLPLLREAVARLPTAELVTYPRLGHTLAAVRPDAIERIARFLASLPA